MGQNPAVGAPNSGLERRALAKLKWLVVRDMVETETASFWYDSPEVRTRRNEARKHRHGSFLFPCAGHAEKEGCFTNTQRLNQFHEKAVEPPGDARSETWFMYHLGRRLKEKARKRIRVRATPAECPEVGISDRGPAARTRGRRGVEGDQRLHGGRSQTRSGLQGFEGGRVDGVRLLDLFGHFPSPDGEPRSQAGARRTIWSRLGLRLAKRPAHPL